MKSEFNQETKSLKEIQIEANLEMKTSEYQRKTSEVILNNIVKDL